jgi:tetratricopeptide (TPR) repeat protein
MGHSDAMRLAPNSPDVLTTRGLVLFLTAKLSQALQHVQSALRFDPGHEPAQRLRKRVKDVERLKEEGNSAFKTGKLQEATAKYTEALDRVGENEDEGSGGQIRATLLSNRATTLLKVREASSKCLLRLIPLNSSIDMTMPSRTLKRPSFSSRPLSRPSAPALDCSSTSRSTRTQWQISSLHSNRPAWKARMRTCGA